MYNTSLQLVKVLEKTVSSDKNELEQASQFLEQAAVTNLLDFIKTLSDILRHGANSPIARMAAGLQLKNHLTSKDPSVKLMCQQRWLAAPEKIRSYIKKNVVGALGTETSRPSSAAQCVAYIAVAELPQGQWPDVISTLVSNVVQPNSTEMQKEATLEAIGYICQEIDSEILVTQSNDILTAIIHGMRSTEPSNHVRLAATRALLNSLEFTKLNFEEVTERNFIMEVVCEATQSPDSQIKVAALQCLVKIMSLYYQYMEPYMAQALFPITLEAMKSENDAVALQGIEFWSNVSDEEVDLSIEANEAADAGRPPTRVSRHYAKGALQFIVPILLQKLTKQEELDDEDDWNPSKAAGVCLMLLATCCENEIIPHVLPFIKENIKSDNWRYRDASLMVFGSILSGLENSTLKPLVEQAMPTLIELMYDNSVIVRDTAAWTFGRICEIIPEAAINESYLKPLLESLINGLKCEPRVAANVCWAFSGLAEAAYESAQVNDEFGTPDTYILSQYFEYIIQRLLETTDRPDGAQANLRPAAYEALMEMVKNSPKDCYVTVQKTTMVILERLQQVLQMENHITTHNDRSQFNDLQSLLCGTLQSVLRKVTKEDAPQISDAIMTAMLTMFNSNSCKNGGVQEDALMAVSTLVEVLGEGFIKYMDAFKPFLYLGLKNHQEYQVCGTAVGLTGDIFRALKLKALPYCDEIMTLLLENLGNQSVHRSVKPQILSVFGDIVLSIGSEFKKYLEVVMSTLAQASQAQVDRNDYDMIDYLNELREGVLDAYTGIVQGLKGDGPTPSSDVLVLESHIPFIVQFITVVAQDTIHSDATIAVAAGLVGDLCTAFGGVALLQLLDLEPINDMLAQGRRSSAHRTKSLANWASKELRKLKNNSNIAAAAAAASWKIRNNLIKQNSYVRFHPIIQRVFSVHQYLIENGSYGQIKNSLDLDDLLPQVGEFGKYQKLMLWFVCLPACFPCGFCAFNQLFMASTPDHWCWIPELANLTMEERKKLAIPMFNGTYSKCQKYTNWSQNSTDELFITENCKNGWEFNTSDIASSIVIDFELVCDKDIYPTLGLVALNLGGPIGVYFFGTLNDRIGRKKSFFVCLTTLLVGSLLTATAQDYWWWAGSRIIVGLTIPAVYQIPFIIGLELVGPNYRSFVTIMTCTFYAFGLIMLAGVAYLIRNWINLAFATTIPFISFYFYWFLLPESPRWLLARGRFDEASKILETLARINNKDIPSGFKQQLKQRMLRRRTSSEEKALQKYPNCFDLCITPNMRLKTFLITLSWFANEMVYVGLSYYGPNLGSNEYLSFLLSTAVEIPSYMLCWIVMDRWGRRWPLCLLMIISGLSCIATVLLPEDDETKILICFLLSKSTISASYLIIYPFAGELYPTQLRGIGIGTSAYIGGIGLIIIPFITYLGTDNLVLPLIIMGMVSVVGGVTSLRLPETLHHRLPQTMEEGEEFGKNFTLEDCLRCIPIKSKSSPTCHYEGLELEQMEPPPDEETPLDFTARRKISIQKLARQTSVMDTPKEVDGTVKMTYWF